MSFFRKINIYYFITLLFLILTANASFISNDKIPYASVMIFIILVALGKRVITLKEIKALLLFSIVYIAFVAIRDVAIIKLDSEFIITDASSIFKVVYLSFIYCAILKEKAAYYLVQVITHLTVLSFFLFAIQLLLPDQLYSFFTSVSPPTGQEFVPGYSNLILFTFTKGLHSYQNSGFAWEPGSFACFLVIALLLNLFLNKFKFDNKSKILIAAIITTFSTTGYLGLLMTFFLAYRYRVVKIDFKIVLVILVAGAAIITIPLLADKVQDVYYSDIDVLSKINRMDVYFRHHTTAAIPLNRFASMIYIYNNFEYNLIWGVTIDYVKVVKGGYNVSISNGIFDFLAKFGLLWFLYLLYRYSKVCIEYVLTKENAFYCIVILLIIGFSECIFYLPIVLIFLFIQEKQKNANEIIILVEKKTQNGKGFIK